MASLQRFATHIFQTVTVISPPHSPKAFVTYNKLITMSTECEQRTLGQHLASRLSQIGVLEFFGVPGDYNLALLDELVKEKDLKAIWCCNELNAGYAADGAARVHEVGCLVVTFTVGGLSAINAVAGAYAENLPVICITGGPNSNDYVGSKTIHHTIGDDGGFMQELECYKQVTCEQVVIKSLDTAHELIDRAIAAALRNSKPVYISVACNLESLHHPSFAKAPIPYALTPKLSNEASLEAAVDATAQFLNTKTKPVLVAGPLLQQRSKSGGGSSSSISAFMELVEASGFPFAFLSAAKGLLPEDHPACMGTYWGAVSSPACQEVVESADAYVFIGALMNDYASVGGTLAISESKMVHVDPYRVSIAGGKGGNVFGCVKMEDFLLNLAKKIQKNSHALEIYNRMVAPPPSIPSSPPGSPLLTKILYKHIQEQLLTSNTILLAETGDAVFNCQKLKLPRGCQYHWSQQYGSIGWSVGATLGLSVACNDSGTSQNGTGEENGAPSKFEIGKIAPPKERKRERKEDPTTTTTFTANNSTVNTSTTTNKDKRVVACIGDGSFQMACQEVSTMLRYHLNPIIILINNGSYTIEVQIHDGPYNVLNNWDYVGLVNAMNSSNKSGGGLFAVRVATEEELITALRTARESEKKSLCFIEAIVHKDDCSRELLEWGNLVSRSNSRPPQNI
jgi:pyruvate decarboxylase